MTAKEREQRRLDARIAVDRAIRKGTIERQSCGKCSTPNAWAHHEDYSKPFAITWLCPPCHAKRHAEKKRRMRAKYPLPKVWLRSYKACEILGVQRPRLQQLCDSGIIRTRCHRCERLVSREDVEHYARNRRKPGRPPNSAQPQKGEETDAEQATCDHGPSDR